jgi:hypothetical protein
MRWFSRLREPVQRKALREEFESATRLLASAAESRQVAVGHRINLATSVLAGRYPTLAAFEAAPRDEKLECLEALTAMERELNSKELGSGLGVGLFKMWLGAVVAEDEALVQSFSAELARLSAKAGLPHDMGRL